MSLFSRFYPIVFEQLTAIAEKGEQKTVSDIEKSDIIPDAAFFAEYLKTDKLPHAERNDYRKDWFSRSLGTLSGTDLIFANPDNGVLSEKKSLSSKGAEKFVTTDELAQYYLSSDKKNVVYYCHKGRRSKDAWHQKIFEMKGITGDVEIRILTYHRGTQRSYIFLIQPEDIEQYDKKIDKFMRTDWGSGAHPPFTREY